MSQSGSAKAAHKMSIAMVIAYALSGAIGGLFMTHFYVRPSPPPPKGFRIFGFPRPRR